MRFKITLEVVPETHGTVLPISYQYELSSAIDKLLIADYPLFSQWMAQNGLTAREFYEFRCYTVSNLYIPRIYVQGDRLQINVPRVQFWLSFYHEQGTRQFLQTILLDKTIVVGDRRSAVQFRISGIDDISPVVYNEVMEYQTLSPLVIIGIRPNQTVEYLQPQNVYFARFMVDELIQRWEFLNHRPFDGDRGYHFQLMAPERRKVVTIDAPELSNNRVVGFMLKFRLIMDPRLHEIAYVCGLGDHINYGFGFLELLRKSAD